MSRIVNLLKAALAKKLKKGSKISGIGIFVLNFKVMAKNTSILLGDYFDNFINQQLKTGNSLQQVKL